MRRMLGITLTLLALTHAPAAAQFCRGLASLPAGRLQATGVGSMANGSKSVGAGVAYALPMKAFGGVSLGMTEVEALEKASLDLGAMLGYQIALGGRGGAQLCPMAGASLQAGPNNAFNSGVDRSTFDATVGLTVGTSVTIRPDLLLVPAAGLGFAHRIHKAESSAGATLLRMSESYGTAQFHLGFVLKQNLSLRPSVEIPLGLEGSNPTVGFTVGYNFGR